MMLFDKNDPIGNLEWMLEDCELNNAHVGQAKGNWQGEIDALELALNEFDKLKQERDEAVALVGVLRKNCEEALYSGDEGDWQSGRKELMDALSITGPDALREIEAMVLDEFAAELSETSRPFTSGAFKEGCEGVARIAAKKAAAKRKGE